MHYSKNHIHASITDSLKNTWLFICIYEESKPQKSVETWALLKSLKPDSGRPWLVGGDFNDVVQHTEKWGGNQRSERQFHMFRDTLDHCQLADLGFTLHRQQIHLV